MTPLLRWCMAVWALVGLVVLAFVDVPLLRWLLVAPVLLVGPGAVAARFVSPDDGRFRPAIALVAGLATLVLVSEVFALGRWFSVESVAAVIAALVVIGSVCVPVGNRSVAALPARTPIDPRSPAAARLWRLSPSRLPVALGSDVDQEPDVVTSAPSMEATAEHLSITSPTLGVLAELGH